MSDHEEIESAIAAWVLGATDPNESETIARHVEGCASCRATAARLRSVADAIPLAVQEAEPAPQLRQRILSSVAAAPRTATAPAGVAGPARASVRRRQWIKFPVGARAPLSAVAAMVLVALAAGLVVGDLAGRSTSPPQQSQVGRFILSGKDSMAGARASVIDLKSDGVAFVDFSGLPALAPGKVYELWLIGPASRVDAAGVFIPDGNGNRVVVVSRPLAGYATMAVTTEQGPDGVAAPTQQPQLTGSIA
jgi:anti-sigma-K factor RskA